jgi:hypothetical protein
MQPRKVSGVSDCDFFYIEVMMQTKFISKFALLLAVTLLVCHPLFAQEKKGPPKDFTPEELQKLDKGKRRPVKGVTFQLSPIDSVKGVCLALLADGQGKTLEEFLLYDKLPILEAIVTEAKNFGLTEEAVGRGKAEITRFSDKQVPNFVVDVSKLGKQTQFYVTMQTQQGKITLDAGTIKRDDPNATAYLYDILAKIQSAKNPIQ